MTPRRIFIPGWAAPAEIWRPFATASGKTELLPWDAALPGGDSSALAARVAASEAPVWLFGWSLGALAALETALALPDRVAALVLVSATARLRAGEGYAGADPRACRAMRGRLRADPSAVLHDFATLCAVPDADETFVANYTAAATGQDAKLLQAGLTYLDETDVRAALPQLRMPVLLIHGTEDGVVPVACGRFLRDAVPQAHYAEIAGAGHAVLHTRCDQLQFEIARFLDGLGAA